MNDLVDRRVEELGSVLGVDSNAKAVFKIFTGVVNEILAFVEEQSKSTSRRFLRKLCHLLDTHVLIKCR